MTLPLDGLRILDLTRLLPGAVCTLLLADLGADVVKVESPDGGDYARTLSPAFFALSNRNKRSIVLNLKHPDGVTALRRLAADADALVESFRPGVLAKLGCDYEALRAVNPGLVFCSLSGWGQTGPYAHTSGHDLNYVALAGLTGAMLTPQPMGGQVADVGGAYAAAAGILAALFRRERTGAGAWVDTSLFESALPFSAYTWSETLLYGLREGQPGSLTGGLACYNVYTSRDGKALALAALEPKFWTNFCATVDRTDLIPDYAAPDRQDYLRGELREIFARRDAADWHALLHDADCCFTLLTPPGKLADDPQVRARGTAWVDARGQAWLASPIRLADGARPPHLPPPDMGAHTREVLRAAGYAEADLDALAQQGVINRA